MTCIARNYQWQTFGQDLADCNNRKINIDLNKSINCLLMTGMSENFLAMTTLSYVVYL